MTANIVDDRTHVDWTRALTFAGCAVGVVAFWWLVGVLAGAW